MKQKKMNELFENVKEFAVKHKKIVATSAAALILGMGMGFSGSISHSTHRENLKTIEAVQCEIDEVNSLIKENNHTHSQLCTKRNELSSNSKSLEDEINALNSEISAKEQAKAEAERIAAEEAKAATEAAARSSSNSARSGNVNNDNVGKMVWKTKTGKRYHSKNNCGNTHSKDATQITLGQAQSMGLTPCGNCY